MRKVLYTIPRRGILYQWGNNDERYHNKSKVAVAEESEDAPAPIPLNNPKKQRGSFLE